MKTTSKRAQATIAKQIAECCDDIAHNLEWAQRYLEWAKERHDTSNTSGAKQFFGNAKSSLISVKAKLAILTGLEPTNPLIDVAKEQHKELKEQLRELDSMINGNPNEEKPKKKLSGCLEALIPLSLIAIGTLIFIILDWLGYE
ncbi:MAG: hypothetical protein K2H33_00235 [Muribaculaceae bacterium]|nr:hypothetical protein [Muribaculaceae bacterium]MDE6119299.1 hypothetical protein [Muribaculaceae bacterium]